MKVNLSFVLFENVPKHDSGVICNINKIFQLNKNEVKNNKNTKKAFCIGES